MVLSLIVSLAVILSTSWSALFHNCCILDSNGLPQLDIVARAILFVLLFHFCVSCTSITIQLILCHNCSLQYSFKSNWISIYLLLNISLLYISIYTLISNPNFLLYLYSSEGKSPMTSSANVCSGWTNNIHIWRRCTQLFTFVISSEFSRLGFCWCNTSRENPNDIIGRRLLTEPLHASVYFCDVIREVLHDAILAIIASFCKDCIFSFF